MTKLKINPAFRNLIPPLTEDERTFLRNSIDEEGCRDPIIVWDGTIIDGHNRYEVCQELEVEFEIEGVDFLSEEEAILWIINNQLGRRNISEFQRIELVQKKKSILLKKGKQQSGARTDLLLSNDRRLEPHSTREELAKQAGVSTGKLAQAEVLIKEAPEEVKQKLRAGTKTIGQAYRETKQAEPVIKEQSKPTFNITNDNIKWAKYSWNPVTGCLHECPYCYAKDIAMRFTGHFKPEFHENRLSAPFNTTPSNGTNRVFICSMADLFGEWVPDEWIDKIMAVVASTPQWTYLCLTKNPTRYLSRQFPQNVCLGMTADTNNRYQEANRIAVQLEQTHKNILFVSFEPLKEEIRMFQRVPFDWVIVGGQSRTTGEPEFQPEWEWVERILTVSHQNKRSVIFKPNLTIKPEEFPEWDKYHVICD